MSTRLLAGFVRRVPGGDGLARDVVCRRGRRRRWREGRRRRIWRWRWQRGARLGWRRRRSSRPAILTVGAQIAVVELRARSSVVAVPIRSPVARLGARRTERVPWRRRRGRRPPRDIARAKADVAQPAGGKGGRRLTDARRCEADRLRGGDGRRPPAARASNAIRVGRRALAESTRAARVVAVASNNVPKARGEAH